MLSDYAITEALTSGRCSITPLVPDRIQPASIDLTLGTHLQLLHPLAARGALDPKVDTSGEWVRILIPEDGFILAPGLFVLGSTAERIELGDDLVGQVEGKSSLGRLGLLVHSTAGFIDPGFRGQVTLELACLNGRGIRLYQGMPVAQLALDECTRAAFPYRGKYVGQDGPTLSRYHQNWDGERWR